MRRCRYEKFEIPVGYYAGRAAISAFRWAYLLCISFIILYPLLYMLSLSLRSPADSLDVTTVWLPKHPTLENYKSAILGVGLLEAMGNTAVISVVTSALQIFSTCLAGYGFARFRFRFRGILFTLAVLSIMVPPQMLNMPNYLIFKNFDFFGLYQFMTGRPSPVSLIDSPLSYWLPAALGQGLKTGLFILIFRQFFSGLPVELEEAALIDGCGSLRTFFKIMLPNATVVMLVFFLFSLVWYWGDYYTAFVNFSTVKTLSVRLVGMPQFLEVYLPREMQSVYYIVPINQAACLFSITPLILLFIFCQKYFIRGIERTGIVG